MTFWARVEKYPDCWKWLGRPTADGYGRFTENKKCDYAHRVVLKKIGIKIPAGMVVDHTCRNRLCVNPDHLRVVTMSVNSTENVVGHPWQIQAALTHCRRGHEYVRGPVNRSCKICHYDRQKERRAKK